MRVQYPYLTVGVPTIARDKTVQRFLRAQATLQQIEPGRAELDVGLCLSGYRADSRSRPGDG